MKNKLNDYDNITLLHNQLENNYNKTKNKTKNKIINIKTNITEMSDDINNIKSFVDSITPFSLKNGTLNLRFFIYIIICLCK